MQRTKETHSNIQFTPKLNPIYCDSSLFTDRIGDWTWFLEWTIELISLPLPNTNWIIHWMINLVDFLTFEIGCLSLRRVQRDIKSSLTWRLASNEHIIRITSIWCQPIFLRLFSLNFKQIKLWAIFLKRFFFHIY